MEDTTPIPVLVIFAVLSVALLVGQALFIEKRRQVREAKRLRAWHRQQAAIAIRNLGGSK